MIRTRSLAILALLAIAGAGIAAVWAAGHSDGVEVRAAVRSIEDGRVEVAVIADGEAMLPDARFVSAERLAARDGRWLRSSPVTVAAPDAMPAPPATTTAAMPATGACAGIDRGTLNYGFFADFSPVSYSADDDPASPGYREHRGYEADLLTALEAMDRTGLSFHRIPIGQWTDIWLTPAGALAIDVTGGGITIRDDRTMDSSGAVRVAFTDGHIQFRQTLLVRSADAAAIKTHADLDSSHTVGAVLETTGEQRMLELVGLIAEGSGIVAEGTRIATPDGALTADGTDAYRITAAGGTANIAARTSLAPPSDDMPNVVYMGSDEDDYVAALAAGEIDAFARGELGNVDAAAAGDGAFAVTAFDPNVEYGGWTVAADDAGLLACLDSRLNYLTGDRTITFSDWNANRGIFMDRAALWNAAN